MKRIIWNGLPDMIRRLTLAWLLAVTAAYMHLPGRLKALEGLEGLQALSFKQIIIMALVLCCILCLVAHLAKADTGRAERYGLLIVYVILFVISLRVSFTVPFFGVVVVVGLLLTVYALHGQNRMPCKTTGQINGNLILGKLQGAEKTSAALWTVGVMALVFFLFLSVWTVLRVLTYSSPSFDFGIFSQMFHYMRTTGMPNTTIERDGLLSHFNVHVSPIYYLMLPVYCFYPEPVTLQVLQAAVLASAVIPLWKLARFHGCRPAAAVLFCQLLLLYPAYSGGASYDLHENAFLTPLLLWLFYAIDRRNGRAVMAFGILTLMVKEDAAVYAAVIGLWLLLRARLEGDDGRYWKLRTGSLLFAGAVVWFMLATGYLAACGDGVMTNRYSNLIYDDSGSLVTVIKAAILSPMKVLYECADQEKMGFILLTMAPLCGLPLMTRRYERYLLLIPYILVNLMSDYRYQHDIFFQYTYSSAACLFYLVIVNYADMAVKMKNVFLRYALVLAAVAISAVSFGLTAVPVAAGYTVSYISHSAYYSNVGAMLKMIPENVSVAATTFYTVPLANREILYDVRYASEAHLLSTEYVALEINNQSCYTSYATTEDNGYDNLTELLEKNGYQLIASLEDTMTIYKKAASYLHIP